MYALAGLPCSASQKNLVVLFSRVIANVTLAYLRRHCFLLVVDPCAHMTASDIGNATRGSGELEVDTGSGGDTTRRVLFARLSHYKVMLSRTP